MRSAFALSESLAHRVRDFRVGRVAALIAGELPYAFGPGPLLLMHVLPIRALDPLDRSDVTPFARGVVLRPPTSDNLAIHFCYNFDGVLYYALGGPNGDVYAITQSFRSGGIEAIDSFILRFSGANFIHAQRLEDTLIVSLGQYLARLKEWGAGTPVFVLMTLLGVRGAVIAVNREVQTKIDRDALFLPEAVIEDFSEDVAVKLRPAFDAMWQAAGWERCFDYDDKGGRLPFRR